jgi:hypothetical protein
MDSPAMILGIAILVLIVFDILALRFGADSRPRDGHPNWW